jgi:hypothetical protein
MRIYIDGAKIFDQWVDQGANALNFSQPISAGTHLVTVQYFEQTGGATAQVSWQLTHAAPPPAPLPPVISSFSANPSTTTPGSPVTLSWNISGATSVTLSGVGDVTGSSSTTVNPSATTVYTLTASSAGGTTTASAIVNISSGPVSGGPGGGTQNPTVPTLVSAIAKSATEVDLTWTASSDPLGISSYQILRNGLPLDSVSGTTLSYADMTLSGGATASYSVRAYDAVGNNSAPSNTIQVTTPSAGGVSVTWYGPCWLNFTLNGITGNYQMIDYNITSPSPVAIQGTLFYNSNCSGSGDNLNDAYYLTNPGHGLKGFSHNVNVSPVSAVYWIGGPTQDGQCPAGSTSCSGCVVYNSSTLSCDLLP